MDIKPSRPALHTSLPRSEIALQGATGKALLTKWQVNSLIEALVVEKTLSGKLILELKGIKVEVADPPPLDFKQGQRWLLQLVKQSPLPVFKLLHAINTGKVETSTIQQALRTIAPKQQPMPPLMANIDKLVQQINTSNSSLPRDVQQLVQQLYQQLPRPEDLVAPLKESPPLKEIMTRIAPILESQLAALFKNEASPALLNVRTQLLRLATVLQTYVHAETSKNQNTPVTHKTLPDVLRTTPQAVTQNQVNVYTSKTEPAQQSVRVTPQAQPQVPASPSVMLRNQPEHILIELARQVEGVLARGQVQQLNSLHAEQQSRPMWALELPLRTPEGIDLFDLRIERDKHFTEEYSEVMPWSITLAFDLKGLGPVRAVVSLRGEQISTRFWAERADTNLLFNQHLDVLHSQLNHAGINVGKLECQCGTLPETTDNLEPVLLDEQV